jgi:hypothetical protein
MIWGDQHEPRIFDFFLEHNIMVRMQACSCLPKYVHVLLMHRIWEQNHVCASLTL